MFHQKNRCFYMQIRKSWVLLFHRNSSMFDRLFQQDQHLHWQGCLHGVHVSSWQHEHSCYHMPVGLHNIVTEHSVGTQRFHSTLRSGLDLVFFLSGHTSALGLELGTRLWFVDWITGEIAPMSFVTNFLHQIRQLIDNWQWLWLQFGWFVVVKEEVYQVFHCSF